MVDALAPVGSGMLIGRPVHGARMVFPVSFAVVSSVSSASSPVALDMPVADGAGGVDAPATARIGAHIAAARVGTPALAAAAAALPAGPAAGAGDPAGNPLAGNTDGAAHQPGASPRDSRDAASRPGRRPRRVYRRPLMTTGVPASRHTDRRERGIRGCDPRRRRRS